MKCFVIFSDIRTFKLAGFMLFIQFFSSEDTRFHCIVSSLDLHHVQKSCGTSFTLLLARDYKRRSITHKHASSNSELWNSEIPAGIDHSRTVRNASTSFNISSNSRMRLHSLNKAKAVVSKSLMTAFTWNSSYGLI